MEMAELLPKAQLNVSVVQRVAEYTVIETQNCQGKGCVNGDYRAAQGE
jgi:hypothetical protein